MIVNNETLLDMAPIKNMEPVKKKLHGVSYGMSEAGYDIRIKQEIQFDPNYNNRGPAILKGEIDPLNGNVISISKGRFIIASAIEEFQMPENLVGIVHDKSTWARQGLSVFNTVIEPGWKGFLTLELVFHGNQMLVIPAGAGIVQVVFHATTNLASYDGKYQNQADMPVAAIHE
jgi:dCTP deaminase